jgi:hypothetical protein
MLAAVLRQLVQGRPSSVEHHIADLYQRHTSQGTRPSFEEVYSALQHMLGYYSSVYVVIDALDECGDDTRRHFLATLRDLQKGWDIRVMATSRLVPDVESNFKESLRLEVRAGKEDIEHFVAGQIYRMPMCIRRNAKLQALAQDSIVESADGL